MVEFIQGWVITDAFVQLFLRWDHHGVCICMGACVHTYGFVHACVHMLRLA